MIGGCIVRAEYVPIAASFYGDDVLRVIRKPAGRVGQDRVALVVEDDDLYLVALDFDLTDAALSIEDQGRVTGGMHSGAEWVPKSALQAVTPDSLVRIEVCTLSGRAKVRLTPALSEAS